MCNLVNLNEVYVTKKIYDGLDIEFVDNQEALPKLETGESDYFIFYSLWRDDLNFNSRVVGFDVSATSTITIPVKQYTN